MAFHLSGPDWVGSCQGTGVKRTSRGGVAVCVATTSLPIFHVRERMKKILLAVAISGCVTNVYADATVPSRFQGKWAPTSDCRKAKNRQDTEAAMSVVQIDATSVSYGEAQCSLTKVSAADASHLDGIFDCQGDGVGGKAALSLKLEGGKLRLVDKAGSVWWSTEALPRCK